MEAKRILCYGDSNTFGSIPGSGARLHEDKRWTGICRNLLGDGYRILEEGLPGRTTVFDDPCDPFMNGLTSLGYILQSQKPLDLVVLCLGANDVKFANAYSSASGIDTLLHHLLNANTIYPGSCGIFRDTPRVLLIAPPPIPPEIDIAMADTRFVGTAPISREFGRLYRKVALSRGVAFLDGGEIASLSPIDCLHLDEEGHRKMGTAVAQAIRDIFEKEDC